MEQATAKAEWRRGKKESGFCPMMRKEHLRMDERRVADQDQSMQSWPG
jgi:hypothetical protein